MAKNVWLKDYKIGIADPKALTAKEAKMVAVTISRGLWKTENSVIRNDASVLRHDLVDVTELTDDLRSRVVDVVKRFNRLREEDLNKTLLDDSSLPMGGNNSDGATSTASEEAVVALSNKINAFERRLDRYGLVETTDSNGNPVPKPGSWADFVSQPRATTDSFEFLCALTREAPWNLPLEIWPSTSGDGRVLHAPRDRLRQDPLSAPTLVRLT